MPQHRGNGARPGPGFAVPGPLRRGEIQETHREHVAIYEALRRDSEAARVAITRHIADSWTRRRKMIEDAALGDS